MVRACNVRRSLAVLWLITSSLSLAEEPVATTAFKSSTKSSQENPEKPNAAARQQLSDVVVITFQEVHESWSADEVVLKDDLNVNSLTKKARENDFKFSYLGFSICVNGLEIRLSAIHVGPREGIGIVTDSRSLASFFCPVSFCQFLSEFKRADRKMRDRKIDSGKANKNLERQRSTVLVENRETVLRS